MARRLVDAPRFETSDSSPGVSTRDCINLFSWFNSWLRQLLRPGFAFLAWAHSTGRLSQPEYGSTEFINAAVKLAIIVNCERSGNMLSDWLPCAFHDRAAGLIRDTQESRCSLSQSPADWAAGRSDPERLPGRRRQDHGVRSRAGEPSRHHRWHDARRAPR